MRWGCGVLVGVVGGEAGRAGYPLPSINSSEFGVARRLYVAEIWDLLALVIQRLSLSKSAVHSRRGESSCGLHCL